MKQTDNRGVGIEKKEKINSLNGIGIREERKLYQSIQYTSDKEHINVMNKPCKSKRAFIELRRELCVSFGVYWCEL
jgi:hypothetical protein